MIYGWPDLQTSRLSYYVLLAATDDAKKKIRFMFEVQEAFLSLVIKYFNISFEKKEFMFFSGSH